MKPYDTVETPANGTGYLHDASINTVGWLEQKLGPGRTIETEGEFQPDWDNSEEVREYIEKIEGREYRLVHRDNVYNSENDFNQVFTFSIYTPADSDDGGEWYYNDDVYVAVTLHRGGDVRGNYGHPRLHKPSQSLADSGFLDWVLGWHVVDAKTEEPIASADRYQVGYAANPTSELNRYLLEISRKKNVRGDVQGKWKDGAFHFQNLIAYPEVR